VEVSPTGHTPAKEVEQELYVVPILNTKLNFVALPIEGQGAIQSRDDLYKTKRVADSVYGFMKTDR
jgi:hypothetical protein